jgi:hypothetical protein
MKKLLLISCLLSSSMAFADGFDYQLKDNITVKTRVNNGKCVIYVKGDVTPRLAPEFDQAILQLQEQECNERIVDLDSGGGRADIAFYVGKVIKNNNYSTKVSLGSQCSSACGFIFIAGNERIVEVSRYSVRHIDYRPNPLIGLHSPRITSKKECINSKENSNLVDEKHLRFQLLTYNYAAHMLGREVGMLYAQIVFQIGCDKTIYADPEKLVETKIATSIIKTI